MIVNASPLIIFGKLNRLHLLFTLFSRIEISKEVYNEVVVSGDKLQDALLVKECVEKGLIKVVQVDKKHSELAKRIQYIFSIDFGEAETIAVALQLKYKDVLMDEKSAREAAKSLNIKPIGTLGILLLAFKKRIIKEGEIEKIIKDMMNSKYRVGAEVIIEFWEKIKELK